MKIATKLRMLLKSVLSLQLGSVVTDKATLVWDSEEDLKEGDEVFVLEGEEYVPAADGEYKTEDNKVITVEGGIVISIADAEAEVAPVEETAIEETADDVQMEETPLADEPTEEETEPETTVEDRVAYLEEALQQITDGLNQIINSLAGLEERMGEVEGKLAKVEAPAAEPIDDTTIQESEHKTKLSYLRK